MDASFLVDGEEQLIDHATDCFNGFVGLSIIEQSKILECLQQKTEKREVLVLVKLIPSLGKLQGKKDMINYVDQCFL